MKSKQYKTCPVCEAHLDPADHCDCHAPVTCEIESIFAKVWNLYAIVNDGSERCKGIAFQIPCDTSEQAVACAQVLCAQKEITMLVLYEAPGDFAYGDLKAIGRAMQPLVKSNLLFFDEEAMLSAASKGD